MRTFFAVMLLSLSACGDLAVKWRGRVWKGGHNEITRDVVVNGLPKTEFMPTSHPNFENYSCIRNDHLKELTDLALRYCHAPR